MKKVLIAHDEVGYVLMTMEGSPPPHEPVGVPFVIAEVPDGKRLVGVDVSTSPAVPILEDIPPTETEILQQALSEATMVIAQQQEQIDNANQAISELTMIVAGGVENV